VFGVLSIASITTTTVSNIEHLNGDRSAVDPSVQVEAIVEAQTGEGRSLPRSGCPASPPSTIEVCAHGSIARRTIPSGRSRTVAGCVRARASRRRRGMRCGSIAATACGCDT
jgi:hypothetical protein